MMTFPQIIRRTPRQRIDAAKYVKLINVKKGYNKKTGFGFIIAQAYSTHQWSPHHFRWVRNPLRFRYVTMVEFLDDKLHCRVSCSCPDFTYSGAEFVLHKKGAAEIEYSNGEAPTVRNPNMHPLCCKHLVKLYMTIKSQITK